MVDKDLSGMFALALAIELHGSSDILRACIRNTLRRHRRIFVAAPVPSLESDAAANQKNSCYSMLDPERLSDKLRRRALEHWLNGDVHGPVVQRFGACDAEDMVHEVAEALLPGPVSPLSRHQRMNTTESVRACTVLFAFEQRKDLQAIEHSEQSVVSALQEQIVSQSDWPNRETRTTAVTSLT